MSKKILALLLVLAMSVSFVLVGCDGNGGTIVDPGENIDDIPLVREPIEISLSVGEFKPDTDVTAQMFQDYTNITVKPITGTGGGWEQLRIWAMADELPDTFEVEVGTGDFYTFIDDQYVRSIPEALLDKYPGVGQVVREDNISKTFKEILGKYYFVTRPNSAKGYYGASWQGTYYRTDWAANVGMAEPKTVDQLYELLRAFTFNDPDKNSQDDTMGLTITGWIPSHYYGFFGVLPEEWEKVDGVYKPNYISDRMIPALQMMRKMYEEKVLDQEFMSNSSTAIMQKFSQNKAGMIMRNADVYSVNRLLNREYLSANPLVDPYAIIGLLGPVSLDANTPAVYTPFKNWYGNMYSSNMSNDALDRMLDWYQRCMETDYMVVPFFGIQGVDWEYDASGAIKRLANPKTGEVIAPQDIYKEYPFSSIFAGINGGFDIDIELDLYADEAKDMNAAWRAAHKDIGFSGTLVPAYVYTPTKAQLAFHWEDDFAAMIVNNSDIEGAFRSLVNEYLGPKNLQKAIDEVNERMVELGIE